VIGHLIPCILPPRASGATITISACHNVSRGIRTIPEFILLAI
jgi:hypothetical protein